MHDITWNHTGAGRCWSLDVGGSTTSVGSTRSGTPPLAAPRRSRVSSLAARRAPHSIRSRPSERADGLLAARPRAESERRQSRD